jgi:hypothetical protein
MHEKEAKAGEEAPSTMTMTLQPLLAGRRGSHFHLVTAPVLQRPISVPLAIVHASSLSPCILVPFSPSAVQHLILARCARICAEPDRLDSACMLGQVGSDERK